MCHSKDVKPVAVLTSYVNVTSGDQNALRAAIATRGPISIGIDASHKSLSFYANGVYYEPKCGKCRTLIKTDPICINTYTTSY